MKRGGRVIYGGSLGVNSVDMINYFQVIHRECYTAALFLVKTRFFSQNIIKGEIIRNSVFVIILFYYVSGM